MRRRTYAMPWCGSGGRVAPLVARLNGTSDAIVDAARRLGDAATRASVAAELGRVTQWGEETGDYRADVRAAGGWSEIRRRAGL